MKHIIPEPLFNKEYCYNYFEHLLGYLFRMAPKWDRFYCEYADDWIKEKRLQRVETKNNLEV